MKRRASPNERKEFQHSKSYRKNTRSGFFFLQLRGIACVFNGLNELIGFDLALLDFDVCFVRQGYVRINYPFDL